MQNIEGTFPGLKGTRLYYHGWLPDIESKNIKAIVLIVHGVAEHCGRYLNLATYLVSHSFAVFGFDLRNHGRSEGKKGTVEHFSYFVDDLHIFIKYVQTQYSDKKIFVFGHSMGATISLIYSREYQNCISGLILSGSAIRFQPHLSPLLINLLRPLSWIMPELGIKKLDSSMLSHDPTIARSYDEDLLVFRGKLSARLAIELILNMHKIEQQVELIYLPMLILHGEEDQLALPEGSRIIFKRSSSIDKTLKIYPGYFHEVLNEPGQLKVLVDIEDWLQKHV